MMCAWLSLAQRGRFGAVADGLRRLLPAIPALVAAEPRRLPVAVVNALHHLDVSPTGDPAGWLDTMLELRLHTASVPEFLDAGAGAAWRRGLAQLRDSALSTANRLPTKLVRLALTTESTVDIRAQGEGETSQGPGRRVEDETGWRGEARVRRVGRRAK